MLARLAADGAPEPVLFDGLSRPGWSERDEAMAVLVWPAARRAPAHWWSPGTCTRARARSSSVSRSVCTRRRPGVREVRVRYGGGAFYNLRPVLMGGAGLPGLTRLSLIEAELVLSLLQASAAVVPHRPGAGGRAGLEPDG